jgi:ABC-2 type transport system permease protein
MKLSSVQTKLYLREPMSVFFTLAFGPIMLVMMGVIFGSLPRTELNGLSQMDLSVPGYIGMIVGITGLTAVPIGAAQRRESGALRRFSATPLRPLTYFLSDILAPFLVTLLGALILALMGLLIYKVQFRGSWLRLFGAVCLSALAFFALGYALAGLVRSARATIVLANVLIIPLVTFSGAMVPLEVMPASVAKIANFLPLKHVVALMRGLWIGEAWGAHLLEVGVLVGILVVGTAVIALTFKWE